MQIEREDRRIWLVRAYASSRGNFRLSSNASFPSSKAFW